MSDVPAACARCRGACCESIVLPVVLDEVPVGIRQAMKLRGSVRDIGGVRIDSRCRHLSRKGLCAIHEARPDICRRFEVGSPACRAAIEANRPRVAAQILQVLPTRPGG